MSSEPVEHGLVHIHPPFNSTYIWSKMNGDMQHVLIHYAYRSDYIEPPIMYSKQTNSGPTEKGAFQESHTSCPTQRIKEPRV